MENKRVLVAFFSHTGENFFAGQIRRIEKGNTHIAAEMVADICKADLFEIKPVSEYSDVYKECVEQAKRDYQENSRPQLCEDIDIHAYDTIFLGYPNWCGTMPMPVWTFLENHGFAGKVLCPFCTNEGSGLANSEKDIKKLAPLAEQKPGLAIRGSQVNEARAEIEAWILGLK
uniref:flavodoxin n=1 Tax=Agathobacter sp. TaxID=2021311 RepID=UPI0040566F34